MISSAVVVPPESPKDGEHSMKRKASDSIYDQRKRPRNGHDTLNYDEALVPSEVSTRGPVTKAVPDIAEKKRNQRLFGGILGVVSQKSTSSNLVNKRRDEIEARTRARAKKDAEELHAQNQRRQRELLQRRQAQQVIWDNKVERSRHANMRATAHYLKTRTEPVLYFKPWDLRPEDEEIIARQKLEVEQQIEAEMGAREASSVRVGASQPRELDVAKDIVEREPTTNTGTEDFPDKSGQVAVVLLRPSDNETRTGVQQPDASKGQLHSVEDDDQADGELVKGLEEDDVIY